MPTTNLQPLALPLYEAFRFAFGQEPRKHRILALQRRGEFPRPFYLGNQAYILRSDLDDCIAQHVAAAASQRELLQARSRQGNAVRHGKAA